MMISDYYFKSIIYYIHSYNLTTYEEKCQLQGNPNKHHKPNKHLQTHHQKASSSRTALLQESASTEYIILHSEIEMPNSVKTTFESGLGLRKKVFSNAKLTLNN